MPIVNPSTGAPNGWPFGPTSSTAVPGFNEDFGVYNSFTGADIVAYIHIPSQEAVLSQAGISETTPAVIGVLGNIQTLSYSTFREVNPVRSLGNVYADSYTRGPRTIAGTIVWTVLDQYVLAQALQFSAPDSVYSSTSLLIDQIPPFSIVVTMGNEYGAVASMCLYDIRIVNEGSTYSIDDMITEQTNTFVAGDIDVLHKGAPFKNTSTLPGATTGTSVLMQNLNSQLIPPGGA